MRYFTTEREGFLYFLDNGKGDIWSADSPDGPWDEYAQYEPGGLQDALNGSLHIRDANRERRASYAAGAWVRVYEV